jgi:hypothetical protein
MNRWYSFGCIGYDELVAAGQKIKNFDDWTNEFCLLAEQARGKVIWSRAPPIFAPRSFLRSRRSG